MPLPFYTGSLSTSEIKRHWAWLVPGWGTAWEDLRVLSAFCSPPRKFDRPAQSLGCASSAFGEAFGGEDCVDGREDFGGEDFCGEDRGDDVGDVRGEAGLTRGETSSTKDLRTVPSL